MTVSAERRIEFRRAVEAILFIADEAVPTADIALLLELSAEDVEVEMLNLTMEYQAEQRGIVVRNVAGGWRFATHPDVAPFLEKFVRESRSARISQAALETLAIVAYRQPISRGQIAEIRGVSSDGVLRTLVSRELIEEVGRDNAPGQAILYGTTSLFLERLGLESGDQLPLLAEFMPDTQAVDQMESGLGPAV